MTTTDGAEVITVTLGDKTFRAGRRTAAHIAWTIDELAREHPGAHLHIIQPCYNDGVDASAGTHDLDGVIDVEIVGLSGEATQTFMRRKGWADWFRTPAQGLTFHNHAVSLGCPGPLGVFVPGQIDDYRAHAFGLVGMHTPGSDTSWFPPDIDSTIFDWEATMPLNDADKAWIESAIVRLAPKPASPVDIAKAVWMWDGFNNAKDKAKALLLRAAK